MRDDPVPESLRTASSLFSAGEDASEAVRAALEHFRRYLALLDNGGADSATESRYAPEDLYLVDSLPHEIIELIGFRIRGHPFAMLGAFRLPKHARASAPNGRASLAQFLSAPPRDLSVDGVSMPPGNIPIYLPRLAETISDFMARVRVGDVGDPIQVDTSLIDIAFDLRLADPSEITHFTQADVVPQRRVARTRSGHVLSGTTKGLRRTLHRDVRFFEITEAWQHRNARVTRLPTVTLNRRFVTLTRPLSDLPGRVDATANLAFHPGTASQKHLLGEVFDQAYATA